ncbi:UDP-N-acetylglucosamine 2-epimerase [Tepidibacter formicigenes]|uniref:GDP/UDP-N,N'-diacetylbacillosamine 2-epimerase (Hydrolysing) n=1 Tax=Tepidibacter formicigenes DSM 15518 TaxID=1123349 RepID=A0A1M6P0B6_9FIRM|nr:UDP-N-acetylglucosamine 2-epimerase [Tepidibacter formicigenes]SHK01354.1 GDP/UDP-N,N'-diacetylbacillosamine 2-epimerase (hydrolysing) [Tepidibacter formicigenes DSM 15518]
MKKIAVVTGTRAEYGLLYNTIKEIKKHKNLRLYLIVTGNHLSKEHGYTVKEIENDGFEIEESINILFETDSKEYISKSMAFLMSNLSQTFLRITPDILLILGDRYEIFASAATAMAMNIPIAHISGGEITEGAIDEQIRHAITKMAHIHFPGNKYYAENIRKMGEESWRIYNVGDPGIENIKNMKFYSSEELKQYFGFKVDRETLLVTFHPVTLEINNLEYQIDNLIGALDTLNKKTIITYPNSDSGGKYIIDRLEYFKTKNKNIHVYKSLGSRRYLSTMKFCGAVVGNSSSAVVEAPYLKIPAVDIGNRQKGRLKAENIISCGYDKEEIIKAVNRALSDKFREIAKNTKSLYGDGNTSKEIVDILRKIEIGEKLLKKKLVFGG